MGFRGHSGGGLAGMSGASILVGKLGGEMNVLNGKKTDFLILHY